MQQCRPTRAEIYFCSRQTHTHTHKHTYNGLEENGGHDQIDACKARSLSLVVVAPISSALSFSRVCALLRRSGRRPFRSNNARGGIREARLVSSLQSSNSSSSSRDAAPPQPVLLASCNASVGRETSESIYSAHVYIMWLVYIYIYIEVSRLCCCCCFSCLRLCL